MNKPLCLSLSVKINKLGILLCFNFYFLHKKLNVFKLSRCVLQGLRINLPCSIPRMTCHGIKSAYHLHLSFQNKNSCGSSGGQAKSNYWKSIWELKVSNSTKVFIWRACKNIWPTKTKLFHTKIVDNALCPICFQCPETISHILWECISARDVWSRTCKRNSKISLVMWLFYRYLA